MSTGYQPAFSQGVTATKQDSIVRPPDYLLPQPPRPPSQSHIPFAGAPQAQQQASTTDMLAQALLFSNLPRPDMLSFDGNVKSWASFYHSFQTQIGSRVEDPAIKLNYLIQFCKGEAKKVIEQCVLLPPQTGYDRAIKQLSDRFGSKHMVALSYITEMKNGPKIQPNNVEALLAFADSLDTAYIVLSQLDYTSDVNSTDTIGACVRRLPYNLANKWVEQAAKITLEQYREPQFQDLVKFVKAQASVANTYYGREHARNNQANWKGQQANQGSQGKFKSSQDQPKPRQTTMVSQDHSGDSGPNQVQDQVVQSCNQGNTLPATTASKQASSKSSNKPQGSSNNQTAVKSSSASAAALPLPLF